MQTDNPCFIKMKPIKCVCFCALKVSNQSADRGISTLLFLPPPMQGMDGDCETDVSMVVPPRGFTLEPLLVSYRASLRAPGT